METNNGHGYDKDKYIVIERPAFKLHRGQAHILKNMDGRRFFTVLCGRRFGKTELIRYILTSFIQHGTRIAVFAPKFKDVEETVGYIVELCETINAAAKANGQGEKFRINKQTKSVYAIVFDALGRELPINECPCVTFNSINTKARAKVGRGGKYDIAIYEETQSIESDTLRENFESTMRPTLSDYQGIAFFFGTPAFSKRHFFHTLAARGVGNNPMLQNADDLQDTDIATDADYMTFRLPTDVNPYIERDELRAAKRSLPTNVYLMEYCAKYVDLNTNIWCDALEDLEVSNRVFVDKLDTDWKSRGLKIVLSMDFNLQPMATVCALMCPTRGILEVVKVFGSKERTTITEMCNRVKLWLCQTYNVTDLNALPIKITGDATGRGSNVLSKSKGSYFDEVLASLGLPKGRLDVKTANPTHESSYFQTNGYLRKMAGLKICKTNADKLIVDMQQTTKRATDNHIDKKEYDPHFLDAFRYILSTYFEERVKFAHALEKFRHNGKVL